MKPHDRKKRDLASVQERIFRKVPETRKLWKEAQPELQVALMLLKLRQSQGLSQRKVAENAGWDKSFVSRLESGQGGIPDIMTVSRYVTACEATGGFVVGTSADHQRFHVVDAVTLSMPAEGKKETVLEAFRDHDVLPVEEAGSS